MLHPAIKLDENSSIHGKGLVADSPIACGEIVWQLAEGDPIFRLSDIAEWPKEKQDEFYMYAGQVGKEEFVFYENLERYLNHSCDPNTWWADSRTLVACRDIQVGEEVTYDYSTADILIDYEMPCNCKSEWCRGIISNKDHLDPAWQKKHGNHLPAHMLNAIAGTKKTS